MTNWEEMKWTAQNTFIDPESKVAHENVGMFSFIDPLIGMSEDNTSFVIQLEAFFDFLEKTGLDKMVRSPDGGRIELPMDVVLSLLKPDELKKLQNYIATYIVKHQEE